MKGRYPKAQQPTQDTKRRRLKATNNIEQHNQTAKYRRTLSESKLLQSTNS